MINDLIFNELLKRNYKLEGKTRVWNLSDSKLWYLSEKQAKGFLKLTKNKDYERSITDEEVALLVKNLPKVVSQFKSKHCNLIDLGCGDGKKASLFINEFTKSVIIRYCPIDINSFMVSKAAKTIKDKGVKQVVEFKWNISDFENLSNITPLLREKPYNTHLLMLLGNTLGNFDRNDFLHSIREAMGRKDVLVIGNGLSEKNKNWVTEYKSKEINKWLIEIPKQLGLDSKDVRYGVRFVDSRIEEYYILKKNKIITHLGKKVEFFKGDFLITAISYKYSKTDLRKILLKFFHNVKLITNKNNTYSIAICSK